MRFRQYTIIYDSDSSTASQVKSITKMEKKHYFTPSEKREFLKIVKKFSPVIENKCTDGNTSRRKNIAWNRITCEYNTSSIAPYPASSKQLRRLWANLKQRNKVSMKKLDSDQSVSEKDFPDDDNSQLPGVEEEINTPFFVSVQNQNDSLKSEIGEAKNQVPSAFTVTESENSQSFNLEIIDEVEEESNPKLPSAEKEVHRLKNNLLLREYYDQKRRQNELHLLQKRLLLEQIREARAKANLAELEVRQQQYLE